MEYYFSTKVKASIESAEEAVRESLKKFGFGVLTEIDVSATFKKKIDKELYPYKILGACNPNFAFEAISHEDKIGTLLPCNVILQEKKPGEVEVSAVDPVASMQFVENEKLGKIASEVQNSLKNVISELNK